MIYLAQNMVRVVDSLGDDVRIDGLVVAASMFRGLRRSACTAADSSTLPFRMSRLLHTVQERELGLAEIIITNKI